MNEAAVLDGRESGANLPLDFSACQRDDADQGNATAQGRDVRGRPNVIHGAAQRGLVFDTIGASRGRESADGFPDRSGERRLSWVRFGDGGRGFEEISASGRRSGAIQFQHCARTGIGN
jgi:hypothetical protein